MLLYMKNVKFILLFTAFALIANAGYSQDPTKPVIPSPVEKPKPKPAAPKPKPVEPELQKKAIALGGVIINGVIWATCNVAEPGTFAANPEDAGMFYQWNRRVAWSATGDITGWDKSDDSGSSWAKANDPSPGGWRVPTLDEIDKLLDTDKVSNEWTTVNGVNGRKFTDKATGNSIFLPAAGCRHNNDGTLLGNVGSYGYYWSSTQYYDNYAGHLNFYSGGANRSNYYYSRSRGLSVRPVAEWYEEDDGDNAEIKH